MTLCDSIRGNPLITDNLTHIRLVVIRQARVVGEGGRSERVSTIHVDLGIDTAAIEEAWKRCEMGY